MRDRLAFLLLILFLLPPRIWSQPLPLDSAWDSAFFQLDSAELEQIRLNLDSARNSKILSPPAPPPAPVVPTIVAKPVVDTTGSWKLPVTNTTVIPVRPARDSSKENIYQLSLDKKSLGTAGLRWNMDKSKFRFISKALVVALDSIVPQTLKSQIIPGNGLFYSDKLKAAGINLLADPKGKTIKMALPKGGWKEPPKPLTPEVIPEVQEPAIDYTQINRAELFQRIFKKAPAPRQREFMVRLFVDAHELEQVKLQWDPTFKTYGFFSKRFAQFLDTCLTPENRKKVNGIDGHFSSERLLATAFTLDLDEAEYLLKISVPAALRHLQVHRVNERLEDQMEGKEVAPATFSAFMNAFMYQDFSYSERFFDDDSAKAIFLRYNEKPRPVRTPFSANLDGAIRFQNFVLQSTADVLEPAGGKWNRHALTRRESQLIRDIPSLDSRITLGDVSPSLPQVNFSAPPLGGIRFDLGNALGVSSVVDENQVAFQLIRPAQVEVFVNGELQKTLQLSSGSHVIAGISGRQGENNIELQVTYEDGFRQSIPFEFKQATAVNLKPGENQGNFAAGVRRDELNLDFPYPYKSQSQAMASAIYHRGLAYNLTGSLFSGGTSTLQIIGARLLWSPDSTKHWEITQTFSRTQEHPFGREFQMSLTKTLGAVSTRIYGSRTEQSFRNIFFNPTDLAPKAKFSLGMSIGAPLWRGSANANANAYINHEDSAMGFMDYSVGASYSLRAYRNLNLAVSGNVAVTNGAYSPNLSLTANYFFNSGNHSAYVINQLQNQKTFIPPKTKLHASGDSIPNQIAVLYDSVEFLPSSFENQWRNMVNAGWSWSSGMGVVDGNSFGANASIASEKDYNARLSYQHTSNFGTFGSSYSVADQRSQGLMARSHYLSTRASTSFMFADGLWGFGRPVNNGFVLTKGRYDLSGTAVRVNPSEQYSSEYSQSFGPMAATFGELSPYRKENILIKLSNPPPGVFLETDNYTVNNTYKQGYALRLGKTPRVFIRVRIVDESNQPLAYTTFQIFEKSLPKDSSVHQSFTNRNGILQAADLEAGKTYIIRFGEDAFVKELEMTIPSTALGIHDFGDRKVEHERLSVLQRN
jgi:outer membrane usher protein